MVLSAILFMVLTFNCVKLCEIVKMRSQSHECVSFPYQIYKVSSFAHLIFSHNTDLGKLNSRSICLEDSKCK